MKLLFLGSFCCFSSILSVVQNRGGVCYVEVCKVLGCVHYTGVISDLINQGTCARYNDGSQHVSRPI